MRNWGKIRGYLLNGAVVGAALSIGFLLPRKQKNKSTPDFKPLHIIPLERDDSPKKTLKTIPQEVLEKLQKKELPKEASTMMKEENGMMVWRSSTPLNEWQIVRAKMGTSQTITQGKRVKIILDQEAHLGGYTLPAGTLLLAVAALSGKRCHLIVSAAYIDKHTTIPLHLKAVDYDHLDGIYCEELGTRVYDAVERELADELIGAIDSRIAQRVSKALYSGYSESKSGAKVILPQGRRFFLKEIAEKEK